MVHTFFDEFLYILTLKIHKISIAFLQILLYNLRIKKVVLITMCKRKEYYMKRGLVVDSCCDLSPELAAKIQPEVVSFKITVGEKQYVDDGTIDIPELLAHIKRTKTAASTACPSTAEYMEAMAKFDECFVVTISAELSASYSSAMVAKDMLLEDFPNKKVHIFNSRSAASGESIIAIKLQHLIEQGLGFEDIVEQIESDIDNKRTLFVLEDLSTLMKNGRLSKVAGTVATILSMRPIMQGNEKGEITVVEKVRGTEKALKRLVEIIKEDTIRHIDDSIELVISYCNCLPRAQNLSKNILSNCVAIKNVILVEAAGLSTVYENDGAVVVSYFRDKAALV